MPPVVAAVAWAAGQIALIATPALYAAGVGAATAVALGSAIGWAVIGVGLNYVTKALQGGPSGGGAAATGVRSSIAAGGAVPQSFGVGRYCTAGSIVYAGTWGKDGDTPNAYLTYVIALSDLPVSCLNSLFVNDKRATYNTGLTPVTQGYPIAEYNVGSKDHLWIKFYDGSQTAVDSFLSTKFSTHPDYPYDSGMVGYGRSYVIITALLNQSLFPSLPNYKFELDGVKLYDQRKDTTAGGSGSHRYGTSSTYELTSNPMVVAHNILRGIKYGSDWFYGLQDMSANRCPSTPWFAAMNECDLDVDDADGNSEDQYRCGAEITVDAPPAEIIDELLKCCNGRMAEVGGTYKPYVGAAGSSIYSFTDSDVIISSPQTFEMFPGEDKLANGIAAVYPEPSESWNMRDAPLRTDAALVTEDDERELIANVNYSAVPYASQVQRLQTAALLEARKFRQHQLVLPPSAYKLEPNDFVEWTSVKNGYISKLFRVDACTDTRNLDVPVVLSECDPADYDFDTISDYLAQTSVTLEAGQLPDPLSAPGNLTASQAGSAVTIRWDQLNSPLRVGYDVRIGAAGGNISSATYLDKKRLATDMTTAAPAAGNYTVYVNAVDVFEQQGNVSSVNLPVTTVVGGAAVKSLYTSISELSLTTNLKLCLDYGDSTCYSGSGQNIYDLTSNDTDFYNGSGSGSDSADMTFNGTAGSLDKDTYFKWSAADYMSLTTANPTWVENLHKSGTAFTFFVVWWFPGWTADRVFNLISTGDDTYTDVGINVAVEIGSGVNTSPFKIHADINRTTGSPGTHGLLTELGIGPDATTPASGWCVMAGSWDDATDEYNLLGVTPSGRNAKSGTGSWNTLRTDAAQHALRIGGDKGGGADTPESNTRIMACAIWNTCKSSQELADIYERFKINRPILGLP